MATAALTRIEVKLEVMTPQVMWNEEDEDPGGGGGIFRVGCRQERYE